MPKKATLTDYDEFTLIKAFPLYEQLSYIKMFEALFLQFASEKKLCLALSRINYAPFKNAIQDKKYKFFLDLIKALPKDKYKKLMLLNNNNEIIKEYIEAVVQLNEETLKMNYLLIKETITYLTSILPETIHEEAAMHLKEFHESKKLTQSNYTQINKLFQDAYNSVVHVEAPTSLFGVIDNTDPESEINTLIEMSGSYDDEEMSE